MCLKNTVTTQHATKDNRFTEQAETEASAWMDPEIAGHS